MSADPGLTDELNTFFARFEVNGANARLPAGAASDTPAPSTELQPLSLSEHNVRRALRAVNCRKAAGPDGIPGRVFKGLC